jgi:hypothetical protein
VRTTVDLRAHCSQCCGRQAICQVEGNRPDIVFTDDSAGGKRGVVEVKTIGFCPSWYVVRRPLRHQRRHVGGSESARGRQRTGLHHS